MKKTLFIPAICMLLILLMGTTAQAQPVAGCDRTVGQRLETAKALVTVDASNYSQRINYWAEGAVHKEPVFTNVGRDQIWEYLQALFGWRMDTEWTITDDLLIEDTDGSATYMATTKRSGIADFGFYRDTGMSIVKFDAGEGCASYQRDYYSEGDVWWGQTTWHSWIDQFRNVYVTTFALEQRCFDDDGDGYTKYFAAQGCPNEGLDCNDYLPAVNPGAAEIPDNGIDDDCNPETLDCTDLDDDGYTVEGDPCGAPADCDDGDGNVHPGMTEIPGNGIDDDCNPATSDDPGSPPCGAPASVVDAEYKSASDLAFFLLFLFAPLGAVLLWSGRRRRK